MRRDDADRQQGPLREFAIFAHRGASGYEPENTLRSFRRAMAMGARWLELDVHAVSGALVVIHDATLERTTNGRGYVMDQSLAYLRSLDAGKGERIPFLEEVLALLGPDDGLNIELKGPATAVPLAALLAASPQGVRTTPGQLLVSSFDYGELTALRRLRPDIRIAPLVTAVPRGYARFAEEMGAYAVHGALGAATEQFIADAHERGLKFHAFTANTRKDMDMLFARGADGAFTDYPDLRPGLCP
ncbi:MAG: glycerophosphodiester phosphodiesterase family protein [Pseudomonadota bacterium]|nr:glycerophosphodiester phosphodiesterase family protein [Pseudomonadota bacterium]